MHNAHDHAPQADCLDEFFLQTKRPSELDIHFLFSLRKRWLYFPVPKAGNSTIRYILSKLELARHPAGRHEMVIEDKQLVHNHLVGPLLSPYYFRPAYQDILRDICFTGDFYRFTLVRNPFTRALSCYLDRFLSQGVTFNYIRRQAQKYGLPFREGAPPSFLDFLRTIELVPTASEMEQHVRPQVDQVMAGAIHYDRVARFENMVNDMALVFEDIYGPGEYSEHFSRNMSPSATDASRKLPFYYNEECESIVRRLYSRDFEAFGYSTSIAGVLP